jgi:hypothetical protein
MEDYVFFQFFMNKKLSQQFYVSEVKFASKPPGLGIYRTFFAYLIGLEVVALLNDGKYALFTSTKYSELMTGCLECWMTSSSLPFSSSSEPVRTILKVVFL